MMEIFSKKDIIVRKYKCVDKKDKKIVEMLIDDGRTKLKKLAREVGLPVTTVFNRVKKMSGDVFTVSAKLNRKRLGYDIDFYILINLDTSSRKGVDQVKLAKRLMGMRNVLGVAVVTGSKDLIVKATAKDIDELSELILKDIRAIEGIAATETLVVMKGFEGSGKNLL